MRKHGKWNITVAKEGNVVVKKSGIDFESVLTILDVLDGLFRQTIRQKSSRRL